MYSGADNWRFTVFDIFRPNLRVTSSQQSRVEHGRPWENMSLIGALPPLATTVTSINQSHDLEVIDCAFNAWFINQLMKC